MATWRGHVYDSDREIIKTRVLNSRAESLTYIYNCIRFGEDTHVGVVKIDDKTITDRIEWVEGDLPGALVWQDSSKQTPFILASATSGDFIDSSHPFFKDYVANENEVSKGLVF